MHSTKLLMLKLVQRAATKQRLSHVFFKQIESSRRSCICNGCPISSTSAKFDVSRKTNRTKYRNVNIYKSMSVRELAVALETDVDYIYEYLLYVDIPQKVEDEESLLSFEVIREVCIKAGVRGVLIARPSIDKLVQAEDDVQRRAEADPTSCVLRPPVVTIMGHVDHGKTTLLDYLRKSNVVDEEFGGITQHIGAFSVRLKHGKSITFLDTPGHAAFSAMRGRGARMTDIIVLVVAADDGVMPQTLESITHAADSNVPLIVAVNKCDRPEAEVEACVEELSQHGVLVEELGGDVMAVKISALKGTNIDALQDAIITLSELLDIKADPAGLVEARVIEAKTEPGRGRVATLLIQRGTLKAGNYLVAGTSYAKVKNIYDEHKKVLKAASPGFAVEVAGWKELPSPGQEVLQVENESKMRRVINYRKLQEQKQKQDSEWEEIKEKRKEHDRQHQQRLKLRQDAGLVRYTKHIVKKIELIEASNQPVEDFTPELLLIVKADVDGSLEAITSCLETYDCDLCTLETVSSGVGVVTENDVELARDFNGVVFAFNTKISPQVLKLADDLNVTIKQHNIIYKLIEDVKGLLNKRIPPAVNHKVVGEAVVQKLFLVTEKIDGRNMKVFVAGCKCIQGTLNRHSLFKLVRDGEVIHCDTVRTLKHFKAEVDDILEGMECGLALSNLSVEVKEGDTLLCYEEEEYQPEVIWDLPF